MTQSAGVMSAGQELGAPLAVRAMGIVKDFSFRRVLDDVSIEVPRWTFLTIFGPNGAGKTTLLRILTTISRPTSGRVEICGKNPWGSGKSAIRSKIGLISHQTLLYDGLTGMENLLFFGRLYGIARARGRAEDLLREFDLWGRRDDRARTYSRGMQQRLAIARALVHEPEILLFDEPFTGLDPSASRMLLSLLVRLKAAGRSAVMATHDLGEGLALGDRWAILVGGRIAASGESREITAAALAERYFEAAGVSAPAPARSSHGE